MKSRGIPNAEFICGDFVDSPLIYSRQYNFCYARFSLHAISESQEDLVLKNVQRALKPDGKFFIEVRSVHDELYGKGVPAGERNAFINNGHFRRFIDKAEFEDKLLKNDYNIIYSEESSDFAPFGNDRPPVIRVIAEKKGSEKNIEKIA